MPVPATTGQLRTKVYEMEIGDYIEVYQNKATLLWMLGEDGGYPELPVTSIASDNSGNRTHLQYFFYMIKVAKGLLVCDRVQYHTISWDSLNSNNLIQGAQTDTGNVIPTMISNTSPSGIASTNNYYQNYQPWRAFDKKLGTSVSWLTSLYTFPVWLAYEFPEERTVNGYSIIPYSKSISPKDWTFEGSNNGQDWVVLDRQIGFSGWTGTDKNRFTFSNNESYLKYRIYITSANGTNLGIQELEMFESTGTIRSLTGGVAYADENSKKSLTDKGYGAWPTNNEWDRYIMNFPQGKIQSGKTLDDVFHYNSVQTWCQDTTVQGFTQYNNNDKVTGSDKRSCRGLTNNPSQMEWHTSNLQQTYLGFRPVFEYEE